MPSGLQDVELILQTLGRELIQRGFVEGAVFERARRRGWTPPPLSMRDDELCDLLRRAMSHARERGLVVEHDGGLVLQDGEGGRL